MNIISVFIPVLNEENNIRDTLNSIYQNTMNPFEIIVADGGSTDSTVEIIHNEFKAVIVLKNEKRTAAAGRNLGIKMAKGNIIAFTDGDCIVDKYWLENIDSFFNKYDIDGMRGKVCNAPPRNRIDRYWGELAWEKLMFFGDEAMDINDKDIRVVLVTANCAYTKRFLYKIKGFNNWFGNNAEDVDLCWRAIESGARLKYNPEARIFSHNITTVRAVIKKSFRNGVSSSKLQKKYGSRFNYDPNIYKMLGRNLLELLSLKKDSVLNVIELVSHLNGKYYGSIRYRVINI